MNEKSASKEKQVKLEKRKNLEDNIEIIQKKRRSLETDITLLLKDADEASVYAEQKKRLHEIKRSSKAGRGKERPVTDM